MEVDPNHMRYEWFYYEHETQLDQLCERLNTKGIRERRLQESLRKVKDILKLKKPKKVKNPETSEMKVAQAVTEETAAVKADEPMKEHAEEVNEEDQSGNKEEAENSESEPSQQKHVMFDTDNYENCMQTAVWFGKKVPAKRRLYGRGASKLDLASELGENQVNLFDC